MSQDDVDERGPAFKAAMRVVIDEAPQSFVPAAATLRRAITAYLSAMPQRDQTVAYWSNRVAALATTVADNRELLREALEALEELISMYSGVCSNLPFGVTSNAETERDLRRARAAADKIRASLTQEKQT